VEPLEAAVTQHGLLGHLGRHAHLRFGADDAGGRVAVVEQGIVVGEPLGGEELLGIEAAVGLAELGVALMGDLTQAVVLWHGIG